MCLSLVQISPQMILPFNVGNLNLHRFAIWSNLTHKVTISYRTRPTGFHWPDGIDERPILCWIEDRLVHFSDGSSKMFDAVIWCTGYKHHFPFIDDPELRLDTPNLLWPDGLYKGVVCETNRSLFYIGMQNQIYTFTMFDLQAHLIRDILVGGLKLPTIDAMKTDSKKWRSREDALDPEQIQGPADAMIRFQSDYLRDLMNTVRALFN
jgi:trimethylamine monooxygenase